MNNAATREKMLVTVYVNFESGWSGFVIRFTATAMVIPASQIPEQHAMMLSVKMGCRRDWEVEKKKRVMMRGMRIEPKGVTRRRMVTKGRRTSVGRDVDGSDIAMLIQR